MELRQTQSLPLLKPCTHRTYYNRLKVFVEGCGKHLFSKRGVPLKSYILSYSNPSVSRTADSSLCTREPLSGKEETI